MPLDLNTAVTGFLVLLLSIAGGYLGNLIKNRQERENLAVQVEQQAATVKNDLDTAAAEIKTELEAANLKDREQLRRLLERYLGQIDTLTNDLRDLREKYAVLSHDSERNERGMTRWRRLAEKRLIQFDGMAREIIDLRAFKLKYEQAAAGLPDRPISPDQKLEALDKRIKDAEKADSAFEAETDAEPKELP